MNDREYARAMDAARTLGMDAGKAAASWVTLDKDNARRMLDGIEEGDPEVLDTLPFCDLSGQWADVPSGPQVYADIMADAGIEREDNESDGETFSELLDEYENAYSQAMEGEVTRRARYYLED